MYEFGVEEYRVEIDGRTRVVDNIQSQVANMDRISSMECGA